MKIKRILSIVLACLMLTGMLAVGSSATDTYKKTEGDYVISGKVGVFLAKPGELLVTKLILPRVLGDFDLDLVGGMFNDATVNGLLASVAPAIDAEAGPLGMVYYVFASDAPEALRNPTASTNDILALIEAGELKWNVTNKDSFVKALTIVMRPLMAAKAQALATDYDAKYAPGLKTLGGTNLTTGAALAAKLPDIAAAGTQLQTQLAAFDGTPATLPTPFTAAQQGAFDAFSGAILNPLLTGLVSLESAGIDGLLFDKLPNLLYNAEAVDTLAATELCAPLMGDMFGDAGFKAFVGGMLTDVLSAFLPAEKVAAFLADLETAGDLKDGMVEADASLIYNLLVNLLGDVLSEEMLAGLLGDSIPAFLVTVLFYLAKALIWLLRL